MEGNTPHFDALNMRALRSVARRYRWLTRVKPKWLWSRIGSFLLPGDRRRVVETEMGIRLYLDPLSHLGQQVLKWGVYEPKTCNLLNSRLGAGQVFVDVGANEGIFSALGGKLVGETGTVVAIEPQSSLRGLIEINCRLNGVANWRIYTAGLGRPGEDSERLFLYTPLQTGMASMVKSYRSTTAAVRVRLLTLAEVMVDLGLESIDLVKVDVEGYERAVVEGLVGLIRERRIRALLLDYHSDILAQQGVRAADIHASILRAGMLPRDGTVEEAATRSYVLYELAEPA
jgi:FkbM family methyltransferase